MSKSLYSDGIMPTMLAHLPKRLLQAGKHGARQASHAAHVRAH